MPPLQTEAQVALAAANITYRASKIGRPFAFETGVNYFAPRPDELADGDFFAAIAEAADCGILLDLNNLWVNARNGRDKVNDVLARLPLDRVWEVHLATVQSVALPLLLVGPGTELVAVTLFDLWQNGQVTELAAMGVLWLAFMSLVGAAFHVMTRRYRLSLDGR